MFSLRWLLFASALLSLASVQAHVHDENFVPDHVLVATQQNIDVDCNTRPSVVFNGTAPGPTLHLKENRTAWIRVYNNIEGQNLTVHWHGLSQRTAPFSDGTPLVSQWPIPSGKFFDYEIRPEIGDAGSYFYHSHVGIQQISANGPLIVHDIHRSPYKYDGDIPLITGDYYTRNDSNITTGLLANPFVWSGEPLAVTVNGQSGTSGRNATSRSCLPHIIDVEPGKVYRLRFIGATILSFTKFAIEEHSNLTVIEADGQYTNPASTNFVQVAPGQRFSYLLRAKSERELHACNKTDYWIRYETRDRPTNVTGYALLRYRRRGYRSSQNLTIPTKSPVEIPADTRSYLEYSLSPLSSKVRDAFPKLSEVTRTVVITMEQLLKGSTVWAENRYSWLETDEGSIRQVPYFVEAYTNGSVSNYTAALQNNGRDPSSNTYPAKVGEVIDIVWQNNNGYTGGWDYHPMHAHGEHYYDLGSGNGTYNAAENEKHFENFTPTRRDTTVLYRYATKGNATDETAGWRAWRIRVTKDNVGAWLMHCHIGQHAVMGMNTVWTFGDAKDIVSKFPTTPYTSGYLQYGGSAVGDDDHYPVVNHYFNGN